MSAISARSPRGAIDRPHVLHLDHTTVRGGAEMALVRLLNAEPSWDPEVLYPAIEEDDVFALVPDDIPRWVRGVRQSAGGSTSSRIGAVAIGARLLAQAACTRLHPAFRRSDVVAANSTRSAAYGAIALRGSRKAFVVHLRDIVSRDSLGRFGYAVMTKLVLPRADGVIANSHATLASAEPFLRDGDLRVVIPSASGLQGSSERAPGDAPHEGPIRIGMLARVDPWKGQLQVLEAFAHAFPDGDEQLDIAGGAPFRHDDYLAQLHARARELGISDRVRFLGHVDDIQSLMRSWDIGVQASLRPEPLGQNVLQYLAAGLATVVAGEGGPTEWVQDEVNGLLVPPRNPAALNAAFRRLAGDAALRRRLGEAGRATPGLLDDHSVAELHARAYAAVAERSATPRSSARSTARTASSMA